MCFVQNKCSVYAGTVKLYIDVWNHSEVLPKSDVIAAVSPKITFL